MKYHYNSSLKYKVKSKKCKTFYFLLLTFNFFTSAQDTPDTLRGVYTDTVGRDGLKPPIITLLDTCPPPRTIAVPTKTGGSYIKYYKSGPRTIPLIPPEIKTATDPKANFTNFNTEQGLALSSVARGYMDKKGNLWFGTVGGGVSRYDGKSFITYSTAQGLAHNAVLSITEDKKGNLWFGTFGGGVSVLMERESAKLAKEHTPNPSQEGNDNVKLDGLLFKNLTTKEGLADDVVYDMVEDTEGNMVFGTNLGYSVLIGGASSPLFKSSSTFKLRGQAVWEYYNNKTGYPIKDLNTNAMCITKVGLPYGTEEDIGVIWGGCGDDKIIRFDPRAVHRNTEPPVVVIQSIRIQEENICWYNLRAWESDSKSGSHSGGKPMPADSDPHLEWDSEEWDSDDSLMVAQQEIMTYGKVLSEAERDTVRQQFAEIEFDGITKFYPLPENLVLPYEYNHVTFEYNAIVTGRHFLVNYQYMLEGQDEKWSPVTKKTDVTYGNLFEGEYTFLLKAQSPEGVWCEPVTYTFIVLPPWYRAWWAYVIYGLMAIMVIWLIVWANGRRLVAQKKLLEEKVQLRTKQLNEKNQDLENANVEITTQKEVVEAANVEIIKQKETLEEANVEIIKQKDLVEEKNKNITDSIHYAKRIQEAILPPIEHVTKALPTHFVLFKPKDIVSGDFYWSLERSGQWIVVAADCTGHGVPGAFMSMLGVAFLNEIISKAGGQSDLHACKILDNLRHYIMKTLHQTGKEGEAQDGMDIALCILDLKTNELQYAGAYNPLYIIEKRNKGNKGNSSPDKLGSSLQPDRQLAVGPSTVVPQYGRSSLRGKPPYGAGSRQNDPMTNDAGGHRGHENGQQITIIEADRTPIGTYIVKEQKPFTNHKIKLSPGDSFYIFSDGYTDQYGGTEGKKFMAGRFKELLLSINKKPMKQQKQILDQTIEEWRSHPDPYEPDGKNFEQMDDILIIGIRI